MIESKKVFDLLVSEGFNFFTGVPDSLLKFFCAYISDNTTKESHIIAANEGNAIGLATGHFLGSGSPALVYLQNSGLGNIINPLISLADKEIYSIPMLIIIGWRGEPGVKDEPQHIKQGRITKNLLEALELNYFEIGPDLENSVGIISSAIKLMKMNNEPTIILVKKNTFQKYKLIEKNKDTSNFKREKAIKDIVDNLDKDSLIVSTTGMISRELFEYRVFRGDGHQNDFLTVGSMGHSSSIALGLALSTKKKKIVCLDGDGSLIMHLGSTAIQGVSNLSNFLHLVLNNGAHDSVGGQPTVAQKINLSQIVKNCGYKHVSTVTDSDQLVEKINEYKNYNEGPNLIEIIVCKGSRKDLGRPTQEPKKNKDDFMNFIQQ